MAHQEVSVCTSCFPAHRPLLTLPVHSVHECNTRSLLLTFLPYHDAPIFGTLLSILPENVSSTFNFLHPYVQTYACPPRHILVYAASNNKKFLSSLSAFVLHSCRSGFQYPALLSFWASLTTETIVEKCDQSGSATLEARKQSQEDLALFLLPIVNEALSISNVSELHIAALMVLTVLASKTHLEDAVLIALMEAIVSGWAHASHAGLICIAVFAEQMRNVKFSKEVVEALLALEDLKDDLLILTKQYSVGKLALGLIRGIIHRLQRRPARREIRILVGLFEAQVMTSPSSALAVQSLFDATKSMAAVPLAHPEIRESLVDLLLSLAETPNFGDHVQKLLQAHGTDEGFLKGHLQGKPKESDIPMDNTSTDDDVEYVHDDSRSQIFAKLTSKIPTRTAYEISFLSQVDSYIFGSLEKVFRELTSSRDFLRMFSALPVLRKTLAMTEPLFLSFYVRIWCGPSHIKVRVAALRTVFNYVKGEPLTSDMQFLFPYILYALSDPSKYLRKATGDLILALSSLYAKTGDEGERNRSLAILGENQLYGTGEGSKRISWLSLKEIRLVLHDVLVPGLEECLLDPDHASRLVGDILNGSKSSASMSVLHDLKMSSRLAILTCLCSHAVHTPLYAVKLQLLRIINNVDKVSGTTRSKLLLPLLASTRDMSDAALTNTCRGEGINLPNFLETLIEVIIPIDRDSIQVLKDIIETPVSQSIVGLRETAYSRLRKIWSSIKPDLQSTLAESLLQMSVSLGDGDSERRLRVQASDTLTALPLSSSIFCSFLENLPTLSNDTPNKTDTSKRRRISHHQSMEANGASASDLALRIRHITFVLEILERSLIDQRSGLLKGLFRVFTDVQHSQLHNGGGIGYLQTLILDCILAIIHDIEKRPDSKIDPSTIRVDVLVDCIRTTPNPQARNTGLLLVSALADLLPEVILHSVMPVFTFMGPNALSQADDFSNHVINQTMDSVIPQLIQSLHKRKGNSLSAVSELLLSFAAAFEHVPVQRRLGIYKSLIDKIGPHTYLFAFIAILIDKYPRNRRVLQFALDLASYYSVQTQLRNVEQYLRLLLDMTKGKPTLSALVLTIGSKQSRDEARTNLMNFVPTALSTGSLVSKSRRQLLHEGNDARLIRVQFEQTLEQLLLFLQVPSPSKRAQILGTHALDALLRLLPMADLVEAFERLLMRTEDSSRRQIMLSFERRMEDKVDLMSAQSSCLQLLPRLIAITQETPDLSLKLSAISSIDKIVELFGKKDLDAVLICAQAVAGETCLKAIEANIRIASLLCLATIVEVAGDASVPVMPMAFTSAMEQLEQSIAISTENASLHNAAYSFLSALLLYVPWMMTGPYLDRLLAASHESANSAMGDECDRTRMTALSLVAKNVDVKYCYATLDRTWVSAMTEGPIAVREHMEILRSTIEQRPTSRTLQLSETLGDLFLKVFDLRRIQLSPRTEDSYEDAEIDEVEDIFNDSAIVMVYSSNDATFRPFFTRAITWASSSLPKGDIRGRTFRQTTWYRFLLRFFGTLKVNRAIPLLLHNCANLSPRVHRHKLCESYHPGCCRDP